MAAGSSGSRAGAEGARFGLAGTRAGFVGWLGGRAAAGKEAERWLDIRAGDGPGGLGASAGRGDVGWLAGKAGAPPPTRSPLICPSPVFGLSVFGSRTHLARGPPGDSPRKAALCGRSLGWCPCPGPGGPDSGCTSGRGLGRSGRRSALLAPRGGLTSLAWLVFLFDFSPPRTSRCSFLTVTRISMKPQRKRSTFARLKIRFWKLWKVSN